MAAQFNDLTMVVAWNSTQGSNEELLGDIHNCCVTVESSDFLVDCNSSMLAHFTDMTMVDVSMSAKVGPFYDLLNAEVFSVTTQCSDMTRVVAG